jgi:hypothetical protein
MNKVLLNLINFSLLIFLCNICEVSAQIRKNTTKPKNNSQGNFSTEADQIPQLLKLLDEDNDNVISLNEIQNIQKVFSVLDLNKDGRLSINEYGSKPDAGRQVSKKSDNKSNNVSNIRKSNRRPSGRAAISSSRNSANKISTARSARLIRKSSGSLSRSIKRPTSRLNARKPDKGGVKPESSTKPKDRSIGKKSVNPNTQNIKKNVDSNVEVVLNLEVRLKDLVESARAKYKDISNASDKQKVLNFMRRDSRKYSSEIAALKSKPDSKKASDITKRIKELETILN